MPLVLGYLASVIPSLGATEQPSFTSDAIAARLPATRVESYAVNVKVRPLLLFWIGRDDVGEAKVTWRKATDAHKAYEFVIGSDPTRAPRQVNRWGFIVEELSGDRADIFGVMKESGEETLAEAEAKVASESSVSTFKVARTTIAGSRAVTGVITLQAPSHLTYRDVDALLKLVPTEASERKTVELTAGTQKGFLVALESLLDASIAPCRPDGRGTKAVPTIRYLYRQTVFELSLESCRHREDFSNGTSSYADVVDGRFRLRNLTTNNVTTFHMAYGASGELRGVPVQATFRPRWWMEIELTRSAAAHLTSNDSRGRSGGSR